MFLIKDQTPYWDFRVRGESISIVPLDYPPEFKLLPKRKQSGVWIQFLVIGEQMVPLYLSRDKKGTKPYRMALDGQKKGECSPEEFFVIEGNFMNEVFGKGDYTQINFQRSR
jgi:hypothetical protein